ncbi:MAG TPA: trimethylamine methyltransferase family protein [Patescibacteria group bacterium]|nr:trimethylamine methyltransferase family protein [Patescibacteria group bacterium]
MTLPREIPRAMETATQRAPVNETPRWDRLGPATAERLEEASLAILERTGVEIPVPEALDLLRHAGAAVDGSRVRIPERLVRWALETAPRRITLHDRAGTPALDLSGRNHFFGTGSDCLNVLDHRSGERRRATRADLREGLTLADALPNIDFVMSMFLPADVDQTLADRHQAAELLARTRKPIVLVTYDLPGLLDGLEMAEIVAGGRAPHAERPQLGVYINVTRGLLFNEDSVRKLLVCAERGVPALWIPVTSGGTTGPITLAGTIAINTAGILAGVVIAELAREGAPVVVPAFGGDSLDLRTMIDPYAGPEPKGVAASLAHRWGLPMFSLGGGSDAKTVDEQSAAEAGLTMLADALAGGHLIHDCGYLESGLTGSLVQLAICDELAGWVNALVRPVDVSDEALALDLVDAHGVDGSYLETDHTFTHYRERWYPTLIDRRGYEAWRAGGATTMAQRAADRVEELLASDAPTPLPPDVEGAVRAVVERVQAAAGL